MQDNTSQTIRTIIAKECGVKRRFITNKTNFMASQTLKYFDCMNAMYTLQHKFHVNLPESNYAKYTTVGDLIRDVNRQLKAHSK